MGFCGFLGFKRGFFVFLGEIRVIFGFGWDLKSNKAGFVGLGWGWEFLP